MQEIQILKTMAVGKDGNKFPTYKMNVKGKKVDLRFRQDSENVTIIPEGYSRINVEGLSESTNSFFPRYYATFKGVCERVTNTESPEFTQDPETGEIKE